MLLASSFSIVGFIQSARERIFLVVKMRVTHAFLGFELSHALPECVQAQIEGSMVVILQIELDLAYGTLSKDSYHVVTKIKDAFAYTY